MKLRFVSLAVIALIIIVPICLNQWATLAEPAQVLLKPDPMVVLIAQDGNTTLSYNPPPTEFSDLHAQTSTFIVNWRTDGACEPWPAGAKGAFQYAVSIWESLVSSSVPIIVDACWQDLDKLYGSGVLGSAGPADYAYNFIHAPKPNTWYPLALANALAGYDLSTTKADIKANFNSKFDRWYFGTGNSTPSDKYNFATVVLHELGHGLGFIGTMSRSGTGAYWSYGTGLPIIFDHFIENGAGQNLLAKYPGANTKTNASSALLAELTSGNVFFNGVYANAANTEYGGSRPELYAPSSWSSGSSIYHVDEKYNPPSANALMTWSLNNGETNYNPGPIVKGIFQDIGWNIPPPVPTPTPAPPTPTPVAAAIPASGGVITTSYHTTTTVTFPAGAVTDTITVTLALTDTGWQPSTWKTIGSAFTLQAVYSTGMPVPNFAKNVTITLDYRDEDVWSAREATAMLYYWDSGQWITATTTCSLTATPVHDQAHNSFSLDVCHFSKFALFGDTNRAFLPVTLKHSP